jgi:hypothetical protein
MPYAYTNTVPGLVGAIRQLRSVFPSPLTPDTLKKWSIAPNNETYVLNVLRFLGVIDQEGKKVADVARAFLEHDDEAFAKKFEPLVRTAYAGLFENFGENAWTLDRDRLISFFRVEDESSATVGARQALTFQVLSGLAGHGAPPAEPKAASSPRKREPAVARGRAAPTPRKEPRPEPAAPNSPIRIPDQLGRQSGGGNGTSLTVRIEINLPVAEDQAVYDRIFKSIRANLIDE